MQKKETMKEELARRLRECGLTQVEISEQAGIAQSTVGRIMSGKITPSVDNYEKLTEILDRIEAADARRQRRREKVVQEAGAGA